MARSSHYAHGAHFTQMHEEFSPHPAKDLIARDDEPSHSCWRKRITMTAKPPAHGRPGDPYRPGRTRQDRNGAH
jgi:hypothetical protein